MSATTATDDTSADPLDQIRRLRDEVEKLARERVPPAVAQAAEAQAEAVAAHVRAHPIRSVLIAAGIGLLIGRLMR